MFQAADDKTNGCSVESSPGCLGSMSTCGAAQWVILSDTWPKFKFFDFQKILKSTWEEKENTQGKENRRFMTDGLDLFSAKEKKQNTVSRSALES